MYPVKARHFANQLAEDYYGERRLNLWSVQYFHNEDEGYRKARAHFLIAAATEKEAKWFLEIWWAGLQGDDPNISWVGYWEGSWQATVGAPDETYTVEVENTTPAGILSRYRGIVMAVYTW